MKVNGMDYKWRSYKFFSDSGHGWLKVPYTAIYRLGIARLISSFSYQKNNYVYLEEDDDASTFIRALKKFNIPYKFKYQYSDRSKIRSYDSYSTLGIYDNDERYLEFEKKYLENN